MIVKNITFVVSKSLEKEFVDIVFKATDDVNKWVEEIKVFKLLEQLDPDSYNYALQLGFENNAQLEHFNNSKLISLIESLQNQLSEPLLYFESHLEKIF